jgi:hypothetical protein
MNIAVILNTPIAKLWARKQAPARPVAAGPKPRMGATLCSAGLRMTVQAGLTDEMWQWLTALGWRELRSGENRLHYRALSSLLVNRLYDVGPDDRQKILLLAIREATRPARQTPSVERSPAA